MDRVQALISCIQETFPNEQKENCMDLKNRISIAEDLIENQFKNCCKQLWDNMTQDECLQINYLVCAALRSSVYTGSFDLRLSIHDKTLFVRPELSEVFWALPISLPNNDICFSKYERLLNNNFIRVMPYEMDEIKMLYRQFYYMTAHFYICEIISQKINEIGEFYMKTNGKFTILSGMMWNSMRPLYTTLKG